MRLCLFLLGILMTPTLASAQAAGGYEAYTDWESWARVVPGEHASLASSWNRSGGNIDANHYEYPPGLIMTDVATVAATLRGPGVIYRFWMPHGAAAAPYAIRMYFDGEPVPRVSSDSGEILGGAYGYFSAPLVNTFAGGQVCYEPIPFRDSLRIETENRAGLYQWYQYSVRHYPAGTNVESFTGSLTGHAQSARLATATMFQNAGSHPAGESASALRAGVSSAVVPAGSHVTVAALAGPGLVRRLSVRMDGATDAALDSLMLRVYYDGDSQPAIDAPMGWFFGAGHGRAPYKSLPMGTDSPEGFYCFWPMPFHESLRVEVFNASVVPVDLDSAVVEYETKPLAINAGYFHAATQSLTRPAGQNWLNLVTASGTGHYVGNLLYVRQHTTPEHLYSLDFLEGDDLVVVDAADSLHGTGLEDAYNGGYYYHWYDSGLAEPEGVAPPFAIRPLTGILSVEQTTSPPYARADQYRWMIADRVPFTQSLEVNIETQYGHVGSEWNSVTFWYQLPSFVNAAPRHGDSSPRHKLALSPSQPNPMSASGVLRFSLAADAAIVLDLLDVSGRSVQRIFQGHRTAGHHAMSWDRGSLPNGVYFLRLRAGSESAVQRVLLIR